MVERQQTRAQHRRMADAILAGKRRPGADRPGPGVESACIVADHAAAEVLADLRRARRELAGDARRVHGRGRRNRALLYAGELPPRLPDGARLRVA